MGDGAVTDVAEVALATGQHPSSEQDGAGQRPQGRKRMLDSERLSGRATRLLAGLLLLGPCLWASAQAQPQPAARKVPSGAELIAGDARFLSRAYAPCMAAAGTALEARRRCVDAEFKVHDDAFNAAYSAAAPR